jgi:hypothetical protein
MTIDMALIEHAMSGAAVYGILSAAAHALPPPANPAVGFGQNFYLWFHNTVQGILSNYDRVKSQTNGKP